ncbi:ubiquinol-cytochrome C reductase [Neohortaea acidophila]|uniref:Complex III subunit 9 n=1 Tax=Neohortaea acidophila TaxID=245834 RepID=A0A6A6Q4R6_9PEZI|nr:ubiquinol-cytochrome C reductase [Neohortaea acidophila]KAF2487292.1 ubiquinol-cytochrome C reductase [Neohortaea acidophila]
MSGLLNTIYTAFVRRNAVFLTTIFVGAFATEMVFDSGSNLIWDSINRGRQWKDIKHKYMSNGGGGDDEGDDDDDE